MTITTTNDNWKLAAAWNQLAAKPVQHPQKRDYVYASEIGAPMYDRILKMRGTELTNPPSDRARRKFLAGNLSEYLVKQILICGGIFAAEEMVVNAQPYSDCLSVHGRCDFKTIAGEVNQVSALDALNKLALPSSLYAIGKGIIESLKNVYLRPKILEIKSLSTFGFDKIERTMAPIATHTLQAYHYQKNTDIPAEIAYLCRDDLRMRQFRIYTDVSESLYRKDLEMITYYFEKNETPPKGPMILFEDGRFTKNLAIEYSPFLNHYLEKPGQPEDYRQSVSYVTSWNNVLGRYAKAEMGEKTPTGKPIVITPKNKEIRANIEAKGYDFNQLIQDRIAAGNSAEENEEE